MVELSAWSCLVGTGAKIELSGAVTKEVFFFFFFGWWGVVREKNTYYVTSGFCGLNEV